MATLNLGAIRYNWKGAYNGSTAYVVNDVVSANGNSYICIQAGTGQAVGNATAYWNIMSSAGTNGTNGTDLTSTLTTQGDIVYRDGSGLARLGYGTAGQVLQTGGSGANPSWATLSGTFKSMNYTITATRATYSYSTGNNNSSSQVDTKITPLAVTVTPQSTSSKFLISCSMSGETSDGPWDYTFGFCRTVGGTDFELAHENGVANQTGRTGKMGITAVPTSYAASSTNNDSTPEGIQYSFVDAPNTTSAITYTATFNNDNSGNWQLNATQDNNVASERFVSTIYVMEF